MIPQRFLDLRFVILAAVFVAPPSHAQDETGDPVDATEPAAVEAPAPVPVEAAVPVETPVPVDAAAPAETPAPVDAVAPRPLSSPTWRLGLGVGANAFGVGHATYSVAGRATSSGERDQHPSFQLSFRFEVDVAPRVFVGLVVSADLDPAGSLIGSEFDYTLDLVPTLGFSRRFTVGRTTLTPRLALGLGYSLLLADPEPVGPGAPSEPSLSGHLWEDGAKLHGLSGVALAGLEIGFTRTLGLLLETGLTVRHHAGPTDVPVSATGSPNAGANAGETIRYAQTIPSWTSRISWIVAL